MEGTPPAQPPTDREILIAIQSLLQRSIQTNLELVKDHETRLRNIEVHSLAVAAEHGRFVAEDGPWAASVGKRIGTLEQYKNMGLGAVAVISFGVTLVWHTLAGAWQFIAHNLPSVAPPPPPH